MKSAQTLIVLVLSFAITQISFAESEFRTKGREVIEKYTDAVVTIEIVQNLKYNYGGRQSEQESKSEYLGVAIDSQGMVVTSLANVDPSAFSERLNPGEEPQYTVEVRSITYILEDGTEIPAKLVLRDNDLDLAYLRPLEKPESEFAFIDMNQNAEAQIFEEAVAIARMGRIAKRTPLAMSGEIQGVVEKPRSFYIPDSELVSAGSGVPVFNENGEILGVVLIRVFPGGQRVALRSDDPYMQVIIPSIDIHEGTLSAPEPDWDEE